MLLPPEIVTGGIGLIIGAVVKLFAMRMDMKHQEQSALLEKAGIVEKARRFGKLDLKFAWTRRVIALTLLAAITAPIWAPLLPWIVGVNVPLLAATSDTSVLFGLFTYSIKAEEMVTLVGPTLLQQHFHYFAAVMGLYFGASIASR